MMRKATPVARPILLVIGLLVFLLVPVLIRNEYLRHLGILGMLFAVAASNWDLTLGYAGVFNFAHTAFFGLGAYTSGILSVKLGVSPWLGILAGIVVAVIASAIVSIPANRLRGIYVALLTFAFSQLLLLIILSQHEVTGGQQGLVGVPSLSLAGLNFRDSQVAYFYLCGALLLASTIFLRRLVQSNFGLSLIALRDFEDYAVSRGVPLARQRLLAFVFSALFKGAAGAIFAHYLIVASPEFFGFSYAVLFLSMILVGGSATIYGPIITGILLTIISELLSGLGPARFMIVAVIIILTMRFLPQGIWGLIQALHWPVRPPEFPMEGVTVSPGNPEAIQSSEKQPNRQR
jgi:branched-chain amino acid transport system permease protein